MTNQAQRPFFTLTEGEQRYLLNNPYALSLLMDHQDQQFSELEAVGGSDGRTWPTERWTQLYERGRAIMAEDLELWPVELRRDFGFTGNLTT